MRVWIPVTVTLIVLGEGYIEEFMSQREIDLDLSSSVNTMALAFLRNIRTQ